MPVTNRFTHACSSQSPSALSRRGFLQVGAIPGLGIGLADLLRGQASAAGSAHTPKAKSVILVWLQGGVSHHDTFDMKPDAATEIRGPFQPIATRLPGVHVCEHLPEMARRMDHLTVLRSLTHRESGHYRGTRQMITLRQPVSAGRKPTDHPDLASIVVHELGTPAKIPPYVVLEDRGTFTSREGLYATGFLPRDVGPYYSYDWDTFETSRVVAERLRHRTSLLTQFNASLPTGLAELDDFKMVDRYTEQAVDLLRSNAAADAFKIDKEPQKVRDRYNTSDKASSYFLIARRLIEAGVRFVTVGQSGWDHHSNVFPALTSRLPRTDRAFCALVDDLEERGLLDETLVIWMTEFGRTPRINANKGRDHWPQVFSIAMTGGGIRKGQIIGASDAIGSEVADRPITPPEVAATILQLLGISPRTEYIGQDRRPIPFIDGNARPIAELLA